MDLRKERAAAAAAAAAADTTRGKEEEVEVGRERVTFHLLDLLFRALEEKGKERLSLSVSFFPSRNG